MAESETQTQTNLNGSSSTNIENTSAVTETDDNTTNNYDIQKFKFIKILSNNTSRKTITVLGEFPDKSEAEKAIILLEKNAFKENDVTEEENNFIKNDKLQIKTEFINNIYGSYQFYPPSDINGVKATVIYPATDKHIEKFSPHEKYIIEETPALYENITKPYIKSGQFSLDWVYNILEHKQETDRIIYEDPDPDNGFILLPDLKWDGKTVETLYCLAIIHKRNIKSLRDLDDTHLKLLKNIRDNGSKAIEKHYNIKKSQLRIYFHYQPSFYHLHVHFNPLKNEIPGIYCEKSHLLDTVINNIELLSDYYKKCTIPFVCFENERLLEKFEENDCIIKKIKTNHINDDIDVSDDKKNEIKAEDNLKEVDDNNEIEKKLN